MLTVNSILFLDLILVMIASGTGLPPDPSSITITLIYYYTPIVMNTTIQRKFPGVHWIWGGGISFVYEVNPCIVVKVPKSGEFDREQFQNELKIYEIFSQHPPCPFVVQCFFYSDNGIFLEYMRGENHCAS